MPLTCRKNNSSDKFGAVLQLDGGLSSISGSLALSLSDEEQALRLVDTDADFMS